MGKVKQFKYILNQGSVSEIEAIPAYVDSVRERLSIIITLASYYTLEASKTNDRAKRDRLISKATALYSKADKIDLKENMTWVGKGLIFLSKGDTARALDYFNNVLTANSKNSPALLAKACIAFNNQQYEESLSCFKNALKYYPSGKATIRLGLGLNYLKLGKINAAKSAFWRTVQLDPKNVDALVGLAILELNQASTIKGDVDSIQNATKKAFGYLKLAHQINPSHPLVLIHLADHYFFQNEVQKSLEFASSAYSTTQNEKTKAEASYRVARAHHSQDNFSEAFKWYTSSIRSWSDYPLAQFGMGQMYLHNGENEKAIKCFESVLKTQPDNFEALRILGSLSKTSNRSKAFVLLKKVVELNPNDVETWIEIAQLSENNHADALSAYEKAKQALIDKGANVPFQLWNNIGVLKQMMGDLVGAREAYNQVHTLDVDVKTQNVTTLYNQARLLEMENKFEEAEKLYKEILVNHPNYSDCYMRLGSIAKSLGQIQEATEMFNKTLELDDRNADASIFMGNLHLSKGEWQPAQKKFEKVLEYDRHDAYSLLSLGNIYYNARFEKDGKEDKYLQHAMDFYWKVLQQHPSNIWAANGVGIIYAEQNRLQNAKDFFVEVREATADMPDVWINLAHVHLAQGSYTNAIKMYQNCLKKFFNNKDPNVLVYLAKAYFEDGKFTESRQTLMKALHSSPKTETIWFNLALTFEEEAVRILKNNRKTVAELNRSISMLEQSIKIYESVKESKDTKSRSEKHIAYCTATLDKASKQLDATEKHEKTENERQAVIAAQINALREEDERKKMIELQEKEEKKLAEELSAREFTEAAEKIKKDLESKYLASSQGNQQDGFIASEDEEDQGKKKKKKGKKKPSEEEASMFSSDEEDEGGESEGKKKREKKDSKRGKRNRESSPAKAEKKRKKEKKDRKEKKDKKRKKDKKEKRQRTSEDEGKDQKEETEEKNEQSEDVVMTEVKKEENVETTDNNQDEPTTTTPTKVQRSDASASLDDELDI
eukprot:TRINITY_DN2598_c0_g1_i2.p1 TRINITY_DN2598_c0_g1~~TRINITY_DN2598_c0_g1_i2.p1  ORF type:complete len:1004 (-),score=427.67 TRINITY_DN2598_c0_g1_i2:118-3129(-)